MLSYSDQIFWLRAGLGAATGIISDLIFGTDYVSGVLLALIVFMASYYLARRVWGGRMKPDQMTKLYSSGIGTYALLFVFLWILFFTVGIHYLNL